MPGNMIEIKALQLAGGISKQPAHERFPGQVADASNANFSLIDGVSKRPGSIFIKKITGLTTGNAYRLHVINRDASEKYLVLYANAVLRVFHIDGTEATVNGLNVQSLTPDPATYYSTNTPTPDQYRLASVADYTIIANTTVALGVTTTPNFAVTGEWSNYNAMTSHTPTSLPGSTSINLAGDNTYHRTNKDSPDAPAGYYEYSVSGNTFPTIQFSPITDSAGGKPSNWADGTLRGFGIRFEKRQDTFTNATWNHTTLVLTKAGNWSGFVLQSGDQAYISGGTGVVAGWYTVVSKTANTLTLNRDITSAGTNPTDVAGGGIGQAYRVSFNGTGGTLPSMQDVAFFIQGKLQAAGAEDALVEWVDAADGTNTGYFVITGPWRGSGAKISTNNTLNVGGVSTVGTNPFSIGTTSDETAAGKSFNPTTVVRVDGGGSGPRTLPVDQRWTRVAAPGDADGQIDATKAPIQLVRTVIGPPATFTYDFVLWKNRTSGSDITNPSPAPFKRGLKISDIGFFRQRFWFLSGEHALGSAASDLFRFYLDDALNLVDSDPIDITLSSDRVTITDFFTPVRDTVLVTTKSGQQYAMGSPDVLSPSSASFTRATTLQTLDCRPVVLDPTVYMPVAQGGKSGLREAYFVDQSVPTDAADVSSHVSGTASDAGLLPADVYTLAPHANSRMVFLLPAVRSGYTSSNGNVLYVSKAFWSGPRKEQSAWTKWTFDASYRIVDIAVIDDYLYMLIESQSQFVIEKVPIYEPAVGNYPYSLHIDRQMELTGTYNGGTGLTTWTLPTSLSDTTINSIVLRTGSTVTVLAAAGTTVTATGDYHSSAATLGRSYSMSITLSEPYPADYQAKVDYQRTPEPGLKMLARKVATVHALSGSYSVACDHEHHTSTFTFTPPNSALTQASGHYTAWAMADMSRDTIRITSSAVTPTTIAGLVFHGDWSVRTYGP